MLHSVIIASDIPTYLSIVVGEAKRAARRSDVAEVFALRRELEANEANFLDIASFHLRPFIVEEIKHVLQFLNRGIFDKPSYTAIVNRIEHFRLALDQRSYR